MFEYRTRIKMHDVDAAGVLFFANQFKLVHDAYEEWLASKNLPLSELLRSSDFHLPIVHAQTDFKKPLQLGDELRVELAVDKIGETSFTLTHKIYKKKDQLAGEGQTVHVAIDARTGSKTDLPPVIKELFN